MGIYNWKIRRERDGEKNEGKTIEIYTTHINFVVKWREEVWWSGSDLHDLFFMLVTFFILSLKGISFFSRYIFSFGL